MAKQTTKEWLAEIQERIRKGETTAYEEIMKLRQGMEEVQSEALEKHGVHLLPPKSYKEDTVKLKKLGWNI